MFKANPKYREQLVEKSTDAAEVLTERLHELARQAEKQAGVLEARVKKPKRRNRGLRLLGWATLLGSLGAASVYGVRRYLRAEHATASPFGSSLTDSPPSTPAFQVRPIANTRAYDGRNASRPATDMPRSEMKARTQTKSLSATMVAPAFEGLVGKEVVDLNGNRIGEARGFYYRESSREPEWVLVKTGLLDDEVKPAPLDAATIDEKIQLAASEELVKEAREFGEVLSVEDEIALYGHYNVRRTLPEDTELRTNDSLRRWFPA